MPPTTPMKDFDAIRAERRRLHKQQTFKIHGETFAVRREVRPDVIAMAEEIGDDETARSTLDTFDDIILAFIDPAKKGHDRYRAARADETDPITLDDILSLLSWLVEVYTGRPTEPSSPSTAGRKRTTTGTASTGASRSRRRRG